MSLKGKRVLITSGPTRGPIDRVRYVTNKSTGRLGTMIAWEALRAGASVTFIFGKGSLTPLSGELSIEQRSNLTCIQVETVPDATRALEEELTQQHCDAVIHLMAVLDYVPEAPSSEKIPSGKEELVIRLVPTPKLIRLVKELSPKTVLVGFKLEVEADRESLLASAGALLETSSCDLVVANDLAPIEAGKEHVAYLVDEGGASAPIAGKQAIAQAVVQAVAGKLS